MNPAHTRSSYFFEVHFNITLFLFFGIPNGDCQPDLRLGTVLRLGTNGASSSQSRCPVQWYPSLWAPLEASGLQVICNRSRREAGCHLLFTHTWHQFFPRLDASLDTTMGQMVEYHRWVSGGLTFTICYPCAMGTSKSVHSSLCQNVCYRNFLNSLYFTARMA
jgi:hypothetical protein